MGLHPVYCFCLGSALWITTYRITQVGRLSRAQFWFNAVFFAIFKSFWTKGSMFFFALVFTTIVHTHSHTHRQRLLDQTSHSEPSFWLALYSRPLLSLACPSAQSSQRIPRSQFGESFIVDSSSNFPSPVFDVWILGLSLARGAKSY